MPAQTPTETTELRWFFDGPLPDDVNAWFTAGGSGLRTSRRDSYLVDGRADVGVKRRRESLLELKRRYGRVRRSYRDTEGWVEEWKRWSPADGSADPGTDAKWTSIDKEIVKRRFRAGGTEEVLTRETRAMAGVGCDAEVATLSVDGRPSWTFALAAFGPDSEHSPLLDATWDRLVAERPAPLAVRLTLADSCGYAEWMSTPG